MVVRSKVRESYSRKPKLLDKVIISIAKCLFFAYALVWLLGARKVISIDDVVNTFYIDFLRLRREYVEVVRVSECEVVTRCRNPCPILFLALKRGLDTRYVCQVVSEPVCKYVLKKLNPEIIFERNYGWIRPYSESCEERIYIKQCSQGFTKHDVRNTLS
ncbi:MAG: hypothetical protein QXG17_05830 [Sulfolobales archaeon]